MTLHAPIIGTVCDRCANRADDVCFFIQDADGSSTARGFCADCLASLVLASTPKRRG